MIQIPHKARMKRLRIRIKWVARYTKRNIRMVLHDLARKVEREIFFLLCHYKKEDIYLCDNQQ